MPQEINGNLVGTYISTDGGATLKLIVCEDSSQFSATSSTNETQTKCGAFSANQINSPTITGSGVLSGNVGAGEVSGAELATLWKNQTRIYIKRQNAAAAALGITAGEVVYQNGYGYVSEYTETSATGTPATFTFTLTFSGEVDVNPASS